jgi:mRNA interferase MazF
VGEVGLDVVAGRFEIFLVNLDPTVGTEIRKTRPCVVISPDEMNLNTQTVIVAPMTTKARNYPTRLALVFQGKRGQIVLDQICTVDRIRLVKRLGKLTGPQAKVLLALILEMFAEEATSADPA